MLSLGSDLTKRRKSGSSERKREGLMLKEEGKSGRRWNGRLSKAAEKRRGEKKERERERQRRRDRVDRGTNERTNESF